MIRTNIFEYGIYALSVLGYVVWGLSEIKPGLSRVAVSVCTLSAWILAGALMYSDLDREYAGFFLASLAFQFVLVTRKGLIRV